MASVFRAPAAVTAAGMSQFEKERQKRIAENKKRMAELMADLQTDLLVEAPVQKSQQKARPKKRTAQCEQQETRRSSRISNKPVPLYCIEEDFTDARPTKSRRSSMGGQGVRGRRCHGTGTLSAVDALYLSGPVGWKVECGSASLAAAEAATDAALELQRRLVAEGKAAYVKLMSASQVSGGFWCQLPIDIVPFYGTQKHEIHLHCDDKADSSPDDFMYSVPGSSTKWPVVYLPKKDGGGIGLSGGWRGFIIDQRGFPNDTVCFEVLDEDPEGSSSAAVAGAAAASCDHGDEQQQQQQSSGCSSAAGSDGEPQQEGIEGGRPGGVGVGVGTLRLHMRAHIFRAADYEAAAAASSPKQQLEQQQSCGLSTLSNSVGEDDAAADGTAAAGTAQDADLLLDIPLATQARVPDAAAAAVPATPASAVQQGQRQQQQQQGRGSLTPTANLSQPGRQASGQLSALRQAAVPLSPEQQMVQKLGLMGAAEAGVLRVKVARQVGGGSSSCSKRKEAGGSSCDAAAAAAAGEPQVQKEQRQQKQKQREKKLVSGSAADEAQRQQQQLRASKRAAATNASKAWATLAGSTAAGGGGGGSSGVQLVPKPASPSELVPPPTEEEKEREAAGGPFWVKSILEHRVNPKTRADEFLVRWWYFGPYWDSWEPEGCLDNKPGTYPWKGGSKAIPEKFRV